MKKLIETISILLFYSKIEHLIYDFNWVCIIINNFDLET